MAEAKSKSRIIYEAPVITWQAEKRFIVPGVSYRGETADYRLFEKMTPSMTQDTLSELYEREKQGGNPHPTDAPLIWAIATRVYEIRDENKEDSAQLRNFLRAGMGRFSNTLTRIGYNSEGEDEVIHNVGTSDQYSLNAGIVGPDNWIEDMPDPAVLETLLGTQDVSRINEVSRWVNGTNKYLWRRSSKPAERDERAVGFYANDNRLYLGCDWGLRSEYPAFRVLRDC